MAFILGRNVLEFLKKTTEKQKYNWFGIIQIWKLRDPK